MTTFTTPLKGKLPDAETTVMDVEVSGTATFAAVNTQAIIASGLATFANGIDVCGASNFDGAVNVSGLASLLNGVDVCGVSNFDGTVNVSGAANLLNAVTVCGAAGFKNTTVSGAFTLDGSIVAEVSATASVSAVASANRWAKITVSGQAYYLPLHLVAT